MKRINSIIEKNASEFRNSFGFGSSAPINLRALLLKLNVFTFYKPLSDKFSGMAIREGEKRYILVNSSQNVGRQNFTICHELYHLFIQEEFHSETTYSVGKFDSNDLIELKADLFASFLLMPKDGILSIAPSHEIEKRGSTLSLDTVVKLEQYFQVYRGALLYRLFRLGLINQNSYDTYSTGKIRSAVRRGYSDFLYTSSNQTELISNYGDLANYLVESDRISEGDYYSLMMDIGIDILTKNVNEKEKNYNNR